MRGRLEKAYASRRDGEHDQSLIGDTMADLDSVLRMFASLMRISQIEANDRTAAFRTVNLASIAREVVELFDAEAEERGADIKLLAEQTDDGAGIPVKESQQVFKRFYRLERSRRTPGNGLGLSLVAAVARLHSARIEMADNAPGLKFRLLFPAPSLPSPACGGG
jgi:signal transduction histidine kinase